MSSGLRKLTLTAHVMSSLGWLGAAAVFLALAWGLIRFNFVLKLVHTVIATVVLLIHTVPIDSVAPRRGRRAT